MLSATQGTKRPSGFDGSEWLIDMDSNSLGGSGSKKKKRKSRWNTDEEDKTVIPGMPTVIPPSLTKEQEKQYISISPSPEPIYNNEGKRLNTREYRTRKKLEDERHALVQQALNLNPQYKPPADYKPPIVRVSDKVMIPQEEHPDINFVGLLIGPRGNTLKNLEKETGAKIIIRGKGSVKEGKIGRKDGQPLPGEDEPLHAYVTANNPENVKKAVEKIKEIIRQGIEVPEGQNDLRRQQLRELALLNGTLRENDGLAKLKQIQQAQTIVTNTIVCTVCGGAGHIAQDCKERKPGDTFRMHHMQSTTDRAKMDSEYMSLMAELGEGPPPKSTPAPPQPMQRPPLFQNQPPPNPMAFNPPWQQQQQPMGPPRPNMGPPNFQPPGMGMGMGNMPPMSQPVRMPPPPGPVPMPGNMGAQVPPSVRPWQPALNASAPSGLQNPSGPLGVPPPPNMLSAPPPPPPSTQSQVPPQHSMPWSMNPMQPGMPHPQMQPPQTAAAPWQQAPGSVPPPPPWQQQQQNPPPPVPPPPPPHTAQQTFSPMAPPPPPPSSFDVGQLSGVSPLLVAPPPPPPPS
ncbi:hypothetical protein C0Q70_02196 [Pomacea canaliculata]|uniref:Branchpoint-bridging protein n=1 Tax=Pomacea canaliculata TaxID=400727 RepID=A0A2T7Q1L0_POMCA|nr:hypothetical protein C0Q70_02196 [Pomacea canaliculata]